MQPKSTSPNAGSNGQGIESASSLPGNEFQPLIAADEERESVTTPTESLPGAEPIAARITALRQSVEEMTDLLSSQSVKAGRAVNQYVHAKPWAALGMVAGLSFVGGAMVASALHRIGK